MTKSTASHFDIIIAGGGMAGATMAIALAPLGVSIALIEAHPYQEQHSQPSFDDRCLALSWTSRQIYQGIGVWQKLSEHPDGGFEAIKKIHISERGGWAATRLDQQSEAVPALGYVVESRVVGQVLLAQMQQCTNIHIFCPASIQALHSDSQQVQATIEFEQKQLTLSAALLIIADGLNSKTRDLLGVQIHQQAYAQTAIIANIETQLAHQNKAYERFTDSGPLAILPLTRNRCSLVWTARDDQLQQLMSLTDEQFTAALQKRFGYRLGQITRVGHRSAYPLLRMTPEPASLAHLSRVALIGNAAHGVHPVAGQGFNLGLRDIAALAQLIRSELSSHQGGDPGNEKLLKHYLNWRRPDTRQVSSITHALVKLFSNRSTALALLRNSGLLMSDIILPLKHAIAHEAMGNGLLQGKPSCLLTGQPLNASNNNL